MQDAYLAMFQIEHTLLRREPTLSRWADYYMANKRKWYYAYVIDGDTITVVDACHAQNMHERRSRYPARSKSRDQARLGYALQEPKVTNTDE